MLKVYIYAKCSTSRNAVKWLEDHHIPHVLKPIRETPPTPAELRAVLKATGGEIRRLFNTSGIDYRELNIKEILPGLTDDQAVEMLASNGNLVKRPFVIGDGVHLTGFKPDAWKAAMSA